MVDNFRPYVKRVVVKAVNDTIYTGEWKYDGTNVVFSTSDPDSGMLGPDGEKRCADGSKEVEIGILFSEPMKEAFISSISPLAFSPHPAT